MPEMREGAQAEAPPFYSEVSKPVRDVVKIKGIIGERLYEKCEKEAGDHLQLDALHPVLTFNAADRAILQFFDALEPPPGLSEPDRHEWVPRQWRKKLPDDSGAMKEKAVQIMGWY